MISVPKNAKVDREQWFTSYMLETFRHQNLSCVHIRETEKPGATDILVWTGAEILGWVELKVDDRALEVSQKEFIRDRDHEAGNAYVARLNWKKGLITMYQALDADPIETIGDPDEVSWRHWFWKHRRDHVRYK